MSHTLYVEPDLGTHRFEVRVGVNERGHKVQADAIARCTLDVDGRQVQAKEGDKDGVSVTLEAADVAALQALVDAELAGKKMAGKGRIEFWVRDSEIEKDKKGTGPWFHYRELVEASGLSPERHEPRNPVLPADTIPYAGIQSAVVDAVTAAIA